MYCAVLVYGQLQLIIIKECVYLIMGAGCSVRGGCWSVRAAADGHLHAPHPHLPPPLPLLRGEGGAGTVAASCQPS